MLVSGLAEASPLALLQIDLPQIQRGSHESLHPFCTAWLATVRTLCNRNVLLPWQSNLALFQTRQQEERRQLEDLFALAGRDLKQGEIPSAFTCQAWLTACLKMEQVSPLRVMLAACMCCIRPLLCRLSLSGVAMCQACCMSELQQACAASPSARSGSHHVPCMLHAHGSCSGSRSLLQNPAACTYKACLQRISRMNCTNLHSGSLQCALLGIPAA